MRRAARHVLHVIQPVEGERDEYPWWPRAVCNGGDWEGDDAESVDAATAQHALHVAEVAR